MTTNEILLLVVAALIVGFSVANLIVKSKDTKEVLDVIKSLLTILFILLAVFCTMEATEKIIDTEILKGKYTPKHKLEITYKMINDSTYVPIDTAIVRID